MVPVKKEDQQNFNSRLIWFQVGLLFFSAAIVARLFWVSVVQHSQYASAANSQHGHYQKLTPVRGSIYVTDKYSQAPYPVATNALKDLVYAVPKQIADPYGTAATLAKILSLDQKTLYTQITTSSSDYLPVKKMLTDQESAAIASSKLAGVYLDQEDIRDYPEGDFLSQVLGFLGYTSNSGAQKVGVYGLEKSTQSLLAGTPGQISVKADTPGNYANGAQGGYVPAIDGTSIVLTIDRAIQFKAESVIKAAVQQHGADSGQVIVADPKTGAILAMANYPSFDPNGYNQVTDQSVFNNASALETYEPGSTMKAVTMSAGIDLGKVTPSTTYNDTGSVVVNGHTIKNSDFLAHGIVPMTQVIDHSLNTGAVFVEQQIGNSAFINYVNKFRFGIKTGVEVQESSGNIQNLYHGQQIDLFSASFGQAVAVTPLQMLQAYMPLANDGKLMQLHLIASKLTPSGLVEQTPLKNLGQIIAPSTASQISAMLVDDVENGYGKQAGVKGYYIAGKTGTSQVAQGGKYVQNDNIGSFLGYGPINDPKFVMLVNVNHPRDVAFAETTAAPAFGQMAEFIINYYGIAPTR